jgi:hypothetical protein
MKKVLKIIGTTLLSIISVFLICLVVLFVNSPGKLEPLRDIAGNKIQNSLS